MQFNDYYRTLELDLSASAIEIRQSYHRLARKYHPDTSTQLNCENIFKDISEAYAGLKNTYRTFKYWQEPIKRINYAGLDSFSQ